ncbi:Prolactin-inducible protein-like protein [Bos mutus]|uniref:Prolactin-inducible protein homolog n=1 Tax=Bos mutus TaxID=72004 RepID=L8J2N1_9CETA|nr:PREDICTED: prolactin-inducible protein homolog isoform X1 [Bos mutus]ELR62981.1 Prolactin-inducible protein-like protein [Bos mutus]
MYSLHLLLRASPVALLLILCLQLRTTKAQEDTTSQQLMTMDLQMLQIDTSEEATVVLEVSTNLRECMVVKAYLLSNIPIEGNFNYKFTSCLCNNYPRRFFWDLQTNSTVRITAVVDVIRELGICPDDWAVIPIKANRFSITKSLP